MSVATRNFNLSSLCIQDNHPGADWPITFRGRVEGIGDHYELDKAVMASVPSNLRGRVLADSESSEIFIYAADEEAAQWISSL